jgi:hypothetical protein
MTANPTAQQNADKVLNGRGEAEEMHMDPGIDADSRVPGQAASVSDLSSSSRAPRRVRRRGEGAAVGATRTGELDDARTTLWMRPSASPRGGSDS